MGGIEKENDPMLRYHGAATLFVIGLIIAGMSLMVSGFERDPMLLIDMTDAAIRVFTQPLIVGGAVTILVAMIIGGTVAYESTAEK